jgi:hypothetical protein
VRAGDAVKGLWREKEGDLRRSPNLRGEGRPRRGREIRVEWEDVEGGWKKRAQVRKEVRWNSQPAIRFIRWSDGVGRSGGRRGMAAVKVNNGNRDILRLRAGIQNRRGRSGRMSRIGRRRRWSRAAIDTLSRRERRTGSTAALGRSQRSVRMDEDARRERRRRM